MSKRPSKRGTLPVDSEFRLPSGYVIARRIDLLQMWFAVATAQHGSMRRAAVMLNVRQPTLSRKIQDLEAEIGITLSARPSLSRSIHSLPSGLSITSTTAGSSRNVAMAGPSAVRNMRALREDTSDRKEP